MDEIITELIRQSFEYQNWGWNALTIGSAGTIFFTFVESWGLLEQNKTIWENRSGESVSVSWFGFMTSFFPFFMIYGFYIKSIAVIFNGLVLAPLHIPIMIGLWKFKGYSSKEKVVFSLSLLMIPAIIILPWKDTFYIAASAVTLFVIATQPWEIWRNKSSGAVDIRLVGVYLASTCFWVMYAYATEKPSLEFVTTVALVILLLTAILWFKYRKPITAREVVS